MEPQETSNDRPEATSLSVTDGTAGDPIVVRERIMSVQEPDDGDTKGTNQTASSVTPSSSERHIKIDTNLDRLGNQLEEDLIMQVQMDTGTVNTTADPFHEYQRGLMYFTNSSSPKMGNDNASSGGALTQRDYLASAKAFERRIILFNKQAIESVNSDNVKVAERIFTLCNQLLSQDRRSESQFEPLSNSRSAELFIITHNNQACLEQKLKRYNKSSEYLTMALRHGTKIRNNGRRAVAILPVMANCAAIASLCGRHCEAALFAARATLLACDIDASGRKLPLPDEQRICCLYNLAAEMEHLCGRNSNDSNIARMTGALYQHAFTHAKESLGSKHKLTISLDAARKDRPISMHLVRRLNVSHLAETVLRMYAPQSSQISRLSKSWRVYCSEESTQGYKFKKSMLSLREAIRQQMKLTMKFRTNRRRLQCKRPTKSKTAKALQRNTSAPFRKPLRQKIKKVRSMSTRRTLLSATDSNILNTMDTYFANFESTVNRELHEKPWENGTKIYTPRRPKSCNNAFENQRESEQKPVRPSSAPRRKISKYQAPQRRYFQRPSSARRDRQTFTPNQINQRRPKSANMKGRGGMRSQQGASYSQKINITVASEQHRSVVQGFHRRKKGSQIKMPKGISPHFNAPVGEPSIECQRSMRRAKRRIMLTKRKDRSIQSPTPWPPVDMRPKYKAMLKNTPNPTDIFEDPELPPNVFRPSLGHTFITDFKTPGWESRCKAVLNQPRRDYTGSLLGPDGGIPNKDRKRKVQDIPEPPNRLSSQDILKSQALISKAVESLKEKIGADRCALFLLDPSDNMLVCGAVAPDPETGKGGHEEFRIPQTAGLVGYVMSTGGLLNLPDAYHYKLFNPSIDKATGYRTKAIVAVPIIGENGVIGVVEFINKMAEKNSSGDPYPESPTFFTLDDMQKIRDGIGAICSKIRPMPVSLTSTSLCPKKLYRKYIDIFTPGLHLLIDTTKK